MEAEIVNLMKRAARKDVEAQFELAEAYRTGNGVASDLSEALAWYRAAAEQGHADAQNNLGSMYLNGMGTDKNPSEAAHWYRKAAEQDHVLAQFNLGLCCLRGNGVEQSEDEAAYWIHAAAEQDHIEAIGQLGTLCRLGQGMEKNIVAAADLHTHAAMEGDLAAVASLIEYRDEIEREALGGSIMAALCMARIFDHGLGAEQDTVQVYAWLQWAKLHGQHDDAPEELEEWESFVSAISSADDVQQGLAQLELLRKRADDMSAAIKAMRASLEAD
ncbi:MAG: sel1 repeat family protein [Nitrosomonadales bacterium]|nr:sel1 repeat family protein [Nitrosomonadales bacterium]